MGHQVSVAFPKNITLLDFFPVILVHNKSFLSTFYQLTDSTPKKNRPVRDRICPVRDAIYAEVLVETFCQIITSEKFMDDQIAQQFYTGYKTMEVTSYFFITEWNI